jgi:hypothetical protein
VKLAIDSVPRGEVAVLAHGVGRNFDGVDIDEHTVIGAFDSHLVKNCLASPRLHHELRRP